MSDARQIIERVAVGWLIIQIGGWMIDKLSWETLKNLVLLVLCWAFMWWFTGDPLWLLNSHPGAAHAVP